MSLHLGHKLLLLLGFSLSLEFSVNQFLSLEEFASQGVNVSDGTLVPRMVLDVFNGRSVCGVNSQDSVEHILEFFTVESVSALDLRLISFVGLPEDVLSAGNDQFIVGISLGVSLGEWGSTTDQDEEDDTTGKKIDCRTAVRLSHVDFGSHVRFSTQDGVQLTRSVFAREEGSKTEIGDLEVETSIEQKVFGLEISVGNTLFVAVFESFNDDSEVSSGGFFRESARVSDVFKEFTTRDEFHEDGDDFVRLAIFLDVIDGFVEFKQVNNIGVLELSKDFDFLLEGLHVKTGMGVLDDFDGTVVVGSRVETELDSGVVAGTESFNEDVVTKSGVFVFDSLH